MTCCEAKYGVKEAEILVGKGKDIGPERRGMNRSNGAENVAQHHIDWELLVVGRYHNEILTIS